MHTVGAAVGAAAEHGAGVRAEAGAGAGVEVGAGAEAGAGARAGAGASVAPTVVLPMVHRPGARSDPSLVVEGSADPARPMAIVTGDDRAGRVVHGTRGEAALVPAAVGAAAGDSSAAGAGAGARIGRVDARIPQTGHASIAVPARSDGAADRGKEAQRPRIPTSLLTAAASQSSILVSLSRSIRRAQLRQSTVATTRWSLHTAGLRVLCIALQRFPAHLRTLRLHRRPCKLQLRLRQRI